MKSMNVFDGLDAVKRFLSPENVAPLVLLPQELNPFHKDRVRIYAKVYEAHHIKFVTAWGMLQDARKKGRLKGAHTLVENSSGNTLDALDSLKGFFGIKKVVAVIPHDLSGGKFDAIRLRGMGVEFHDGDGIAKAIRLGKRKGWYNLNQYGNPANPAAHKKWTGRQLFEQTKGRISIAAMGLGTTGTMIGVSQHLREKLGRNNVTIVAAVCAPSLTIPRVQGELCVPSAMIPGVRSVDGLKDISLDWRPWFDDIREITTHDAYVASWKMLVKGIMCGPSSGFAFQALLNFLGIEKAAERLDKHRRGPKGEIVAVVVCPDSHHVYQEKYLTHMALSDWKNP